MAGLVTTPARDRVVGARVLPRADGGAKILAADLVMDATGRSGRTPAWLKELGYDPPAEEQLQVDIKYASRYLRLPAGAPTSASSSGRPNTIPHSRCNSSA